MLVKSHDDFAFPRDVRRRPAQSPSSLDGKARLDTEGRNTGDARTGASMSAGPTRGKRLRMRISVQLPARIAVEVRSIAADGPAAQEETWRIAQSRKTQPITPVGSRMRASLTPSLRPAVARVDTAPSSVGSQGPFGDRGSHMTTSIHISGAGIAVPSAWAEPWHDSLSRLPGRVFEEVDAALGPIAVPPVMFDGPERRSDDDRPTPSRP